MRVEHLRKFFPIQSGFFATLLNRGHIPSVKAVDDVSFTIRKGEVFGLAGESGSGKSTVGRLVLRLLEPTVWESNSSMALTWTACQSEEMRRMRSRMQIVFQDPLASLNPRMTLGQAIDHPARIHLTDLSPDETAKASVGYPVCRGDEPRTCFL